MKKTLSLLLLLALCLGLCACGNEPAAVTTQSTEASSAPTEVYTAESMAGTYESILWCFHDSITLNANTTYDYKDNAQHTSNTTYDSDGRAEKGIFSISEDSLTMEEKKESGVSSTLTNKIVNGSFYDTKWRIFKEDVDYGRVFSPDANGMTDQTFESWLANDDIPGSDHNCITLDLNSDGTFTMQLGRKLSTFKAAESYTGTYAYSDSILTLTYEGNAYPLYVSTQGQIHFVGYKKA